MQPIKTTEDLQFELQYKDGTKKHVEEGILFEFKGNEINSHIGTNRPECLFAIIEAVYETAKGMGLEKELKKYMGIASTSEEKTSKKVEDLKIYRIDDYSWYVAHNLMEFLNWFNKNVDSIEEPDDLAELEVIEPENGQMWSDTNITEEDIKKLGDYVAIGAGGIGDLKRYEGEIWKMQTFAEALGNEDIKEPYEIASTEW